MSLKIGDKAPDFTLLSDTNESISLKNFRGKKVILFFYPKDNTPGCTREACHFRDKLSEFSKKNTIVLGISKDSVERHQKFKQKHQFNYPLLADTDGTMCKAYNVLKKKSLFGYSYIGIQRSTFLIDEKGFIRAIWPKVKVLSHIREVLNELDKN